MEIPHTIKHQAARFVPERLRGRPEDERRARLIVGSALGVAALTAGLAVARLLVDGPRGPIAYVLFGVVGGMLVIPLVLRVTGSATVGGAMIPLIGTAGTTTMAFLEGGLESEALFWFIFIPLVAVLFVGFRGATVFGALGVACLTALLFAEPIDGARFLKFAGVAGALGFSALLGGLYEASRRRADRHKDEFVASVSHELRTPLTTVQGAMALLDSGLGGQLDDDAKALVHLGKRNADRLHGLVEDLLTIRDLDLSDECWSLAPASLRDIVLSAVDQDREESAKRSVQIVIEGEVPDINVVTDRERLRQVLRSLLSNAVKNSPPGNAVTVRATVLDGQARIAIEDRGQGISESFRPRMFEKFTQADGSTTRQMGGAGLGLAIAHRLLERLGGRLRFETTVGKGTIFYVTVPTP